MEPISVTHGRKELDTVLSKVEKAASLAGKLQWTTNNTRVDMAYETCAVSNAGKSPTLRHIFEANKAIKKMQSSKVMIKFPNLGELDSIQIICYTDATHAALSLSGASQGAYLIFICGKVLMLHI